MFGADTVAVVAVVVAVGGMRWVCRRCTEGRRYWESLAVVTVVVKVAVDSRSEDDLNLLRRDQIVSSDRTEQTEPDTEKRGYVYSGRVCTGW